MEFSEVLQVLSAETAQHLRKKSRLVSTQADEIELRPVERWSWECPTQCPRSNSFKSLSVTIMATSPKRRSGAVVSFAAQSFAAKKATLLKTLFCQGYYKIEVFEVDSKGVEVFGDHCVSILCNMKPTLLKGPLLRSRFPASRILGSSSKS